MKLSSPCHTAAFTLIVLIAVATHVFVATSYSMQAFRKAVILSRRVCSTAPRMAPRHSSNRIAASYSSRVRSTNRFFCSVVSEGLEELNGKIKAKGDEVRLLKEGGSDKALVQAAVQELLILKGQLALIDGSTAAGAGVAPEAKKKETKQPSEKIEPTPKKKYEKKEEGPPLVCHSFRSSPYFVTYTQTSNIKHLTTNIIHLFRRCLRFAPRASPR